MKGFDLSIIGNGNDLYAKRLYVEVDNWIAGSLDRTGNNRNTIQAIYLRHNILSTQLRHYAVTDCGIWTHSKLDAKVYPIDCIAGVITAVLFTNMIYSEIRATRHIRLPPAVCQESYI